MYDDYVIIAPYIRCNKILYTSHYAYITHPEFETKYNYYFTNIFKKVIENQQFLTLFVISEDIKEKYIQYGFPESKINILHNGAREDLFQYKEQPLKGIKSIYLAKIEMRKCQYKYQSLANIDFVGNYQDSSFDTKNKNYLGEWNKSTLYNKLSEYANLILLSEGEADPLVVKEALLCGLGVVISYCSCANLDISSDFITVIPMNKLNDLEYINNVIIENRNVSIQKRDEIRKYGLSNFSWEKIINKYLELI
jgi:glycosyltransferase involved in cell wall biosynthesis